MLAVTDVTGQRFGRWTIVRVMDGGSIMWLCRCDCGNEVVRNPRDIQRGKSRSCGCAREDKALKLAKDLDGLRFGRLLVIAREGTQHSHATWLCRCDCGSDVVVLGNLLRSGLTTSCGCFRRENASLPPGEAAFNAVLSNIKRNARKRGIDFHLSKNEVRELIVKPCHYCGQEPSQGSSLAAGKQLNGNFIYNGIDRMDNSRAYTTDNVVPCCGVCNRAKLTMTVEEFHTWVERVHTHLCGKRSTESAQ